MGVRQHGLMHQFPAKGIYRTAQLHERGLSMYRIEKLVAAGVLKCVANGWYVDETADPRIVRALAMGCRVACLSACKIYGLWVPEGSGEHYGYGSTGLPAKAAALRAKADVTGGLHFHPLRVRGNNPVVALGLALRHVVRFHSVEDALVVIESAIQRGYLSVNDARELLSTCGVRGQAVSKHVVGLDQSGTETRVRLTLAQWRIPVRSQVWIPGVGRVDLLVGNSLIIECDSWEHHSRGEGYEADRRRDAQAKLLGYKVLRLSYAQVWREWDVWRGNLRRILATKDYKKQPKPLEG